ncbi:uncharacterized protein LOC110445524 [Mizuhopecten yessoensis]|uniref:Uncharacterized protein n=1 Tax=Mizuhopecten yessoensis TaxID=6573 RepID=A0A210QYV6_MIZYE|nr:uncharacterized protein LOC110445524 [Mizuhopecten yessoensis]OWF53963.1 hypothetical protein KP79_PYT15354 [Mizuhopecten yessoensis]
MLLIRISTEEQDGIKMLRLICLLPCLVALTTGRMIYNPYNVQRVMNPYQNNYGYNPLANIAGNVHQLGHHRNNFRGNGQEISSQFISDIQERNEQMISDLRSREEQRMSDLRSQQEQLISDLGGSELEPRLTQQWW